MNYPSISIEGNILSGDILEKIDQSDIKGQLPKDFGLQGIPLKDEINTAFTMAQSQWQIFQTQINRPKASEFGTEETRRYWILPLMGFLGYELERGQTYTIQGKTYALSHWDTQRGKFPVHIVGFRDEMDKKRERGGTRMSPHALLQEFLNLHEHLYAVVTNGRYLRLLRDSSRLVKLSYLEFDLQQMMEEGHFADFALMYRLLHASRMPEDEAHGHESLIEFYHQDALESGSRIREGLSQSVQESIEILANGFLAHADNHDLRTQLIEGKLSAQGFYQQLLRIIYRLLFLFVIEERKLIYPRIEGMGADEADLLRQQADIYEEYYSLSRLRQLSEKRYLADQDFQDVWIGLRQTFRLFQSKTYGEALGIQPLAGDLFGNRALPDLESAELQNRVLLTVLRKLNRFYHKESQQYIRVNYAALNVEEFGSVYENLLDLDPDISGFPKQINVASDSPSEEGKEEAPNQTAEGPTSFSPSGGGRWEVLNQTAKGPTSLSPSGGGQGEVFSSPKLTFSFIKGEERSSSGSHYTPDELVKPLITHSLDHLIADKIAAGKSPLQKAENLLSLRVCDVACGSGHILLAAARRIGWELAKVRTGEDQPSPGPLRRAIREVIQSCIYGVDKNPLAVELCKVALWLEAHNPGEPLNFLDHHIKCGDAIVGLARYQELMEGIATEAFQTVPGDDKGLAADLRKRNKKERSQKDQLQLDLGGKLQQGLRDLSAAFVQLSEMPESTPQEIAAKQKVYEKLIEGPAWLRAKNLADLQVAQFFIPKLEENRAYLMTQAEYQEYLRGKPIQGSRAAAKAMAESERRRFFHWFLEFPEVFIKPSGRVKAGAVQQPLFGNSPKPQLAMDLGSSTQVSPEPEDHLGFDCILGNPPFLGGQKLSGTYGKGYTHWLQDAYAPAGSSDLVTYFFRRIFTVIRRGGFQSLISTNTIAQGGAREGGLAVIKDQNGSINHAIRSMRWPGRAAVEVALVSIYKGSWYKPYILEGKEVKQITSYLDDAIPLGDPEKLIANANQSFQGSIVLGKGFVLEPEQARSLIQRNPQNAEVIYPYLNGSDLNSEPDGMPTRYVINFHDWPLNRYTEEEWKELSEERQNEIRTKVTHQKALVSAPPDYENKVAADYPDCLAILEEKVKPERTRWKKDKDENEIVGTYALRKPLPELWWIYGEKRPGLYRSIAPMEQVLSVALTSKSVAFKVINSKIVFSHATGVIAGSWEHITPLQSTFHYEWAWKYASSMKNDLRYTPSGVFETFPFPLQLEWGSIGKYFNLREKSGFLYQLGLTKLYNQFHNSHLIPESNQPWGSILEAETLAQELSSLSKAQIEKQYGKESWNLVRHIDSIQGTHFRPRDPHAILRGEEDIYRKDVEPIPAATLAEAIYGIWELRRLHVEMDEAVLAAYGWHEGKPAFEGGLDDSGTYHDPTYEQPLQLRHAFYEVDYLPENDRIRFTLHPDTRKEVLRRLLLLNHARYAEEVRQGLHDKKRSKTKRKPKKKPQTPQTGLFS